MNNDSVGFVIFRLGTGSAFIPGDQEIPEEAELLYSEVNGVAHYFNGAHEDTYLDSVHRKLSGFISLARASMAKRRKARAQKSAAVQTETTIPNPGFTIYRERGGGFCFRTGDRPLPAGATVYYTECNGNGIYLNGASPDTRISAIHTLQSYADQARATLAHEYRKNLDHASKNRPTPDRE